MNRDIPLASEVAGLEEFLATTFRTPSPDTSETTAPPPDEDAPAAPPAPSAVHVADLDGRAGATAKGQWRAEAIVSLRDDTGAAVDGALVALSWVGARGEAASVSCTTDGAGACRVSAAVKRTTDWVSFSVVDVAADGLAYTGTDNADPDGDSDGTTVVVARLA